jgi:hypothetical protein
LQHSDIDVPGRRKINAKETLEIRSGVRDGFGWHFELANERVGRRDAERFRRQGAIRAWRNNDLILTGFRD